MQSQLAIGAMAAAQQPITNGDHHIQRMFQTSSANRTKFGKLVFKF